MVKRSWRIAESLTINYELLTTNNQLLWTCVIPLVSMNLLLSAMS